MLSGDPIDSIGSPIKFIVHPVVNMYTVGYCCVVPAFYCSASESIVCDVILQFGELLLQHSATFKPQKSLKIEAP